MTTALTRALSPRSTTLDDARPWVRYYACQALGRRQTHVTCARIEALLRDEAGQVRVAAVEALSAFKLPQAQQALRRAAEGGDPDMQRAALIGLGLSRGPEVLPVLLKAAAASDASTRLVALSALTESAPEAALPTLTSAATDPDANVASAALAQRRLVQHGSVAQGRQAQRCRSKDRRAAATDR